MTVHISHANSTCGILVCSWCPDQPLVVVEVNNLRGDGEDVATDNPFLYLGVLHYDGKVAKCLME